MGMLKRGLVLVGLLVALAGGAVRAVAQLATTTVQDTVYRADGTPAGGSVVITWNGFTTAQGVAVAAGTTAVTIGAGGALSVALAPNAGSVPMGSYYTAVFHLNDGTTTRQYWAIPVTPTGGGAVKLSAISATVLPASVAMQTVSKDYVDRAIAAAAGAAGAPLDSSLYVEKSGDTMTGPLVLPGDPVSPQQAADMHYVNTNIAAVSAGLSGKVSLNPGTAQSVAQPVGTQLDVNNLNGELYASQYVNGAGNNGIANALGSADCANGCEVVAERTYATIEPIASSEIPPLTQVIDERGGSHVHLSVDPLAVISGGHSTPDYIINTSTRSQVQLAALEGNVTLFSYAEELTNNALTGGNNAFPEGLGSGIPYFKSTFGVESLIGNYNTQGQHVQVGNQVNCFGVGDCLAGGQFIRSDGGFRDSADEGTHPFDLQVYEDSGTFAGTCASGCTAGSTLLLVAAAGGGGSQGDGRYLIDKNPAKVLTAGQIVSGNGGFSAVAIFTGTSFPLSVFVETAAAAVAQPHNIAPGTVTLPIATSGVPSGFATSTATLPATGVACMVETVGGIPNFEMAAYSVVDSTHVQVTLNRPHGNASAMAVGGLCGYGLEETVDTVGPVRQVFPVLGSATATSLYYAGGVSSVVGIKGQTGGFLNDSVTVASIARSGNVVTVTAAGNLPDDVNGLAMTVNGVADPSYNGTYVVTTTGPNTLTYANTGANSTSSGGIVTYLTGGYVLYPIAEVLSVYNAANKTVDGTLTLSANTVNWATGDAVEEPHYYLHKVGGDVEFITQYQPRPTLRQGAGKYYQGKVANNLVGWEIANQDVATDYIGSGGTMTPPIDAYSVLGYWQNDLEVEAGRDAVIRAHCNARGCGRWDSGYALFLLDSATGVDALNYAPESDTVAWSLGGTSYTFSPSAFTAGTINVGTLNATTIAGGIAAGAITSGTISPAVLPVFGPSGPTHAVGAVPDPGAVAGNTRYLREDGVWIAPPSGGGSGGSGSIAGGAAYQIPQQTAANTTGFVASPNAAGTYVLSKTLTGATDAASTWALSPLPVTLGSTKVGANSTVSSVTGLTLVNSPSISTTSATAGFSGYQYVNAGNNNTVPVYCDICSAGSNLEYGQGQGPAQMWLGAWSNGAYNDSLGIYVGPAGITTSYNTSQVLFTVTGESLNASESLGWSSSATNAGTANTARTALTDTQMSRPSAGVIEADSAVIGDAKGTFAAAQFVARGAAPTMAAGAAAGTGPSCTTVTGANMAGVVTCTTGTATSASGTLAAVTFNGGVSAAPQGCWLMARNAAAASASTTVYVTAPTVTGWAIAVGAAALGASTTYSWSYSCM